MKPGSVPALLALLAIAMGSAAVASAQAESPNSPQRDARETRPPVPPGVPTTPENVHWPTEGEVKLGREGMAEVEKQYRVLTSGPYVERLQRVGRDVVQAVLRPEIVAEYRRIYRLPKAGDRSRRVPFQFTFRVLDTTKEINAFSLAGGPIYVTRGLLDYAISDHELAAVLAHEVVHVTYHHVEQLVRKQRRLSSAQIWGLLATLIAGAAGGGAASAAAGNVLMASQLVSIATLNGYGRELESEADRIALKALAASPYHPVGMLTLMQKLARDDRLHGSMELGIFQSHPYMNERVAAVRQQLEAMGYRTDAGIQRQVSGAFRVEVVPVRVRGRDAAELRLNGRPFFTAVAGEGDLTPMERARQIALQLQALFADNLKDSEVRQSEDRTVLLLRGLPVIRVYPEDAEVAGGASAATEKAQNEILRALLQEKLDFLR